jgi:hypothetical protein
MKSILKRFLVSLAIAAPLASYAGYDIRSVPLPNPQTAAQALGYSATIASQMVANPADSHWAVRPSGWTASTDAMKSRMTTALSSSSGMSAALANTVINMCKTYARDPYHCALYASAIMCAESTCGQAATTNIFGRQAGLPATKNHAIREWITPYNNNWYASNEGYHYGFCKYPSPTVGYAKYCNTTGGDFATIYFYSNVATLKPFSEYCLSEVSSNSSTYCPNGYANSKAAYLRVR